LPSTGIIFLLLLPPSSSSVLSTLVVISSGMSVSLFTAPLAVGLGRLSDRRSAVLSQVPLVLFTLPPLRELAENLDATQTATVIILFNI
jgi:hypothetical protein